MLLACIIQIFILLKTASSARHTVDGKYHKGIKDFTLFIPRRILSNGEFNSFRVRQPFASGFFASRVRKRSLEDPTTVHYSVWLNNDWQQLDLKPNHEFLNPNFAFEHLKGPLKTKRGARKLCYFQGKVRGFDRSTVSLSTCDGLLGHIRIEESDYFVEPVEGHEANDEGHHLHVAYDLAKKIYRKRRSTKKTSWCATRDSEWGKGIEGRIRGDSSRAKKRESEQRLKPKYMEVAIVCDKSMVEFHKGHRDLDVYLLTVANTVRCTKKDASFGSELSLSLVRVVYLDKEEPEMDLNVSISIEDTLTSFNKFAERINLPEGDPMHHDVAMLASRVDMCQGAKLQDCVVCGVAKIGGACTSNSSANVAEDDGVYELAMTMTHEAGHLLGITHDGGEGLGKVCTPNKTAKEDRPSVWIMSVVDSNAVYMGWSECSRAMSATFIKNGWADCMNDEPERTNKKFPHVPIGALYTRDEQCILSTARKGFSQFSIKIDLLLVLLGQEFLSNKTCGDPSECKNLYCQYYGKNSGCKTLNHMVADGTSCGEDKWCWNSTCVPQGQRPEAVDGGWSDWEGWSECSRSCGGGIQINKRSCNNPRQANGGRYCDGDDQKLKLCNIEPCEESFRDKTCRTKFQGVALFLSENPCQVPCINSEGKIKWWTAKVPEAEPCSFGQKPKRRCLFGDCVTIGCDDEIGSSAMLDDCGICSGDGTTCTVVEGRWNQKRGKGPLTQLVTKIPMGAFNIKIREATASLSKLSIVSENGSTVYVNDYEGKHRNASFEGPKEFKEGVLGYLSIDGLVENFTIEVKTKEHLLIKVVYLAPEADFKWRYSFIFGNETISTEERTYRWEQDGWTECSKVCGGGIQQSTFSCVEDKQGKVSDGLCQGVLDSPEVESKACKEQPCKTRWRVGQWGDCNPCTEKGGITSRGVECMQENSERGADDILVEDDKCEEPKPGVTTICRPVRPPRGLRSKKCTMGLPESYMDFVWAHLDRDQM